MLNERNLRNVEALPKKGFRLYPQSSRDLSQIPFPNQEPNLRSPESIGLLLDKLEQVDHEEDKTQEEEGEKTLFKRARAKFFTQLIAEKFIALFEGSDNKNILAYDRMLQCNNRLDYDHFKQSYVTNYCGNRFCIVCNRIRTGKLIAAYADVFAQFEEPVFLTLTKPTVKGGKLRYSIDTQMKAVTNITRRLKRKGMKVKMIRKLECTVRPDDLFHPHFHLVIDGRAVAEAIRAEWLKEYPKATKRNQVLKTANKDTLKELFKYMAKPFVKTDGMDGDTYVRALDVIYTAMKGKRTITTYGGIKAIKISEEETENLVSVQHQAPEIDEVFFWQQMSSDWIGNGSRTALSGYELNQKDLKRLEALL